MTVRCAPMVRAIGINHVALEVGAIDDALARCGRFLEFELRGKARAELGENGMAD